MAEKKREPCFLIEMNAQGDDKVRISPIGLVTGTDGRVYQVNADEILARMKMNTIDIALNVNHGWEEHGDKAAGWFDLNSLEVRDDGIYASLSPTDIGQELIDKKHFRYLSPEYNISWNGDIREVKLIVGVGLVNRPNVLDEALNKEENKEEDNMAKQKPTAEELQTQLDTANEENAQHEQNAKVQKVDTAIASGELLPANKTFATELNDQQLDTYLVQQKAQMAHLQDNVKPDENTENNSQMSDEQKAVDEQLGLGE